MYLTVALDFIVYCGQQNLMKKMNHWTFQRWETESGSPPNSLDVNVQLPAKQAWFHYEN